LSVYYYTIDCAALNSRYATLKFRMCIFKLSQERLQVWIFSFSATPMVVRRLKAYSFRRLRPLTSDLVDNKQCIGLQMQRTSARMNIVISQPFSSRDRATRRVSWNRGKCRTNVRQISFAILVTAEHFQGHSWSPQTARSNRPYSPHTLAFSLLYQSSRCQHCNRQFYFQVLILTLV